MMLWECIKINYTIHSELKKTGVKTSVFFIAINNILELLTVRLLTIC